MKVSNLLLLKDLTLITHQLDLNKPIDNIYVCDLLSFVLGHVKEANTMLLTIQSSLNVIAVATLLEIPVIIFCDNVIPNSNVINKAIEEGIILFKSELSSAKLLKVIYESLL